MKAFLIIGLVVAALVGILMTLLSTRGTGIPSQDVLERAKQREREQETKDEASKGR